MLLPSSNTHTYLQCKDIQVRLYSDLVIPTVVGRPVSDLARAKLKSQLTKQVTLGVLSLGLCFPVLQGEG